MTFKACSTVFVTLGCFNDIEQHKHLWLSKNMTDQVYYFIGNTFEMPPLSSLEILGHAIAIKSTH